MKLCKTLALLLALVALLSSCSPFFGDIPLTVVPNEDTKEENIPTTDEIYTELGIPLAERYPNGEAARCAWDMALFEGGIFLGSGDYDINLGPAEIWRYDIASGELAKSGVVPDEEVNAFRIIYDTLVAPGTDPKEDWELGNYYAYEDGEWVSHRVLPGGVHCFDIIEYDGMIFAGMGVVDGNSPIVFSIDAGESFLPLPIYKDGKPIDTAGRTYIRVYDFFIYNDELYAFLYFSESPKVIELYRYDYSEDAFFFCSDWQDKYERRNYKYDIIGEKLVFDGKLYFTTGYLYETADMTTLTRIDFPNNAVICDLYTAGDTMYVLVASKDKESNRFRTAVYALKAGEASFTEVVSFLYDVPPMSMVTDGEDLYIGMGNGKAAHKKNGMLLRISLPQ